MMKVNCKGIRYSLEQDGMAVEVAYDGRQALCGYGSGQHI